MGTGDRKPQFSPRYDPIMDDVIGKMFTPGTMRSCPEPHVITRFGTGGVCNVSIYTCRRCKYHINEKWFGGVRCGYTEQKT